MCVSRRDCESANNDCLRGCRFNERWQSLPIPSPQPGAYMQRIELKKASEVLARDKPHANPVKEYFRYTIKIR